MTNKPEIQQDGHANLLIKNGAVIDGTGKPSFEADLAIDGDKIIAIGDLKDWQADEVLDATGYVVAPGFIDAHTHDDGAVLSRPDMTFKVSQGVSTVIGGNCGISMAPYTPGKSFPDPINLLGDRDDFFPTVEAFKTEFEKRPPAVNLAMFAGHGMLRAETLDSRHDQPATDRDIEIMGTRLRDAVRQGALGLSTGLDYPTSAASTTQEVTGIAAHLTGIKNAIYSSHIRDEGDLVLEALAEAFEIGKSAELPVIISHHKCAGTKNYGRSKETLAAIDTASSKQAIGLDVYPYIASSTVLLESYAKDSSDVLIGGSEPYPEMTGRMLRDIMAQWECSMAEAIQRLCPADATYFGMDEGDLTAIMAHPKAMIGSDGLSSMDHPHPRLWGTFPRVLGRYVRDQKVLTLCNAIHKMTGLPASTYNLDRRGTLTPGRFADVVLFDPDKINDLASFDDPKVQSVGIHSVIVNGKPVWQYGTPCDARPGSFLSRNEM